MILSSKNNDSVANNWKPNALFEGFAGGNVFKSQGHLTHPVNVFNEKPASALVPRTPAANSAAGHSAGSNTGEGATKFSPLTATGPGESTDSIEPLGGDPGISEGGRSSELEEIVRKERAEAFAEGMESGRLEATQSLRSQVDKEKQVVKDLILALNNSLSDSSQFFFPMEKLAVHLAVQLVRGELSLSGAAISRLISNCLVDVDPQTEKLSLKLNPDDLEMFNLLDSEFSGSLKLVRDPSIARGGVRVEMANGAIEDLIENRLDALAKSVLGFGSSHQFNSAKSVKGMFSDSDASPGFVKPSFGNVFNHDAVAGTVHSDGQ